MISRKLKESLVASLVDYYPFLGRIKDKGSIDCNNEGVLFSVSRVGHVTLDNILEKPDVEVIDVISNGIAMEQRGRGLFVGYSSELPWLWKLLEAAVPERPFSKMSNIVNKRFVFTPTKLDHLRDMTSTSRVPNPTRVEVVTSIIFRCAIKESKVASLEQGTKSKPSMMSQTVNLLRWVDQRGTNSNVLCKDPLIVLPIPTRVAADHDDEKELDLERLVVEMRKGIERVKTGFNEGN
ncbi:BAHD acyltransferase BIA1-like protein [Drosera capensis]